MDKKSNIQNKHPKPVSGNIFLLISPKGATILILGLASLNRLSKLNTVEVIRSLDFTSFTEAFKISTVRTHFSDSKKIHTEKVITLFVVLLLKVVF